MVEINSPYGSKPFAFGIPDDYDTRDNSHLIKYWYICREDFHRKTSPKMRFFFFKHGLSNAKNPAAFIERFETKLGLSLSQKTLIGDTDMAGTCWVKISTWWSRYAMRRSLFTALLRSSVSYDRAKDNFQTALYSQSYTRETRNAVAFFLQGNTVYRGNYSGWVEGLRLVPEKNLPLSLVPEKPRFAKNKPASI